LASSRKLHTLFAVASITNTNILHFNTTSTAGSAPPLSRGCRGQAPVSSASINMNWGDNILSEPATQQWVWDFLPNPVVNESLEV
jgi:hypothetical protein